MMNKISSLIIGILLLCIGIVGGAFFSNSSSSKTDVFLRTNYSSARFFDEFYQRKSSIPQVQDAKIKAIVVPHHLLAGALIADVFRSVSKEEVKTIILISPNHFQRGKQNILTTGDTWKTPYGLVQGERDKINTLLSTGTIAEEREPFTQEHGIGNIVPFMKKTFPEARVLPIILKDSTTSEQIEQLVGALQKIDNDTTLFVGSFDFSHYMPPQIAQLHDETSIDVIRSGDVGRIERLDIDSKPGLDLLMRSVAQQQASHFVVQKALNSADILKDKTTGETTSYVAGYFTNGQTENSKIATFSFFGDLMLDRYIREAITKKGPIYPFLLIKRLLSGTDIVVANLEGTVTEFTPQQLHPQNVKFTFSKNMMPILKQLGVTHVSLANNHSHDFGDEGVRQTVRFTTEAGLLPFGDYKNKERTTTIIKQGGKKIGLVGYNQFFSTCTKKVSCWDDILDTIRMLRKEVDFLIVFPHWGVELRPTFAPLQQKKAHEMIDAGADLVIGSHPHVVQPTELYKGKMIFYSLGNFIFDQTTKKETSRGLMLGFVLKEKEIQFMFTPIGMHNLQAVFLAYPEAQRMLKDIGERSLLPDSIKQQFSSGSFILPLQP